MKFTELGLIEPIVRAVADKGYTVPSPIQAQAIPAALEGRDILGTAQTGTGKTCAFALPILDRLAEKHWKAPSGRAPRALVLAPTRELASQIFDSFVAYGANLRQLRHAVVFGGVNQRKQVTAMRAGVDVLVATPGRLLDLINQRHIDLSKIEVLVLDEADRMLDMGFIHDIKKVVAMIPDERQTLFFSATVSGEIRRLTQTLLFEPVVIETAPESTTVDSIAQRIYMVEKINKPEMLTRLLSDDSVDRALVFSKTKYGADKLVKVLRKNDIHADSIHGDKSQNARTRAMTRFKAGSTKVMVATDIAARGIDVDNITHVINYDMPIDPETYVHRIGRTARAGATGIAISMCDRDEIGKFRSIERRAKIEIEVGQDHEDLTFEAPQRNQRSFGGGGGGGRRPGGRRPGGGGRSDSRGFGGGHGGAYANKPDGERKPKSKNAKRAARVAGDAPSGKYVSKPGTPAGGKKKASGKPGGKTAGKPGAHKKKTATVKKSKKTGYPKGPRA